MFEKADKLDNIIKEVACPFKAMIHDGSQCFCNYKVKIYKNELGNVALGNIKEDIVDYCNNCQFKIKKPAKGFKDLKIDEFNQVTCPASNASVDLREICRNCAFLNVSKLKERKKEEGEDYEPIAIPCCYPNLPKESMEAWLDAKAKKEIKERQKAVPA